MSLKGAPFPNQKQDCSTNRLTTSEIISNFSTDGHENYDQEFTLMDKLTKEDLPVNLEKCLAYRVARRFPPGVRDQASKIVTYYENALQSQLKQFHRLVEANTKLKRQNDKLSAENYSNKLSAPVTVIYKERKDPLTPVQLNKTPTKETVTPQKIDYRKRIEELEDKVIARDKKINELNGEVGQLSLKLRKYKKRYESTGLKE